MVIGFTDFLFWRKKTSKLDSDLTSYSKISSRCIEDLHVKPEITDILEEHMDVYIYNLRMGKTVKKYFYQMGTEPRAGLPRAGW